MREGAVSARAVGVLVALPLALYLGLTAVTPQPDPDSYWLGAAGRWMLAHGVVPRENLFSFTAPSHPWVMHEWGAAPLYAWGLEAFGPVFLAWLALVTGWAVRALVARAVLRDGADLRAVVGMLLLASFGLGGSLSGARPSTWSLGLVAAMALLAYAPRFDRWTAAGALALELAWVNLHGSFPLGVALLGASAIDTRDARRLRVVTAAAAAAITLLNPYGLRLHAHVLGYAFAGGGSQGWVHEHIVEFRPLYAGGMEYLTPLDLAGLAAVLALALRSLARGPRRAASLLTSALLVLGVFTVRYLPLALVVGVALLTPLRALGAPESASPTRTTVGRVYLALPLAVAVGCHLTVLATTPRSRWEAELLGGTEVPALLDGVPDGARLFAPFYPSSRVLWEAADRGVRVFYDLRNDCYPPEVADAALRLSSESLRRDEALALLRTHDVDHVLAPAGSPVARILADERGWGLSERRGRYVLFARTHLMTSDRESRRATGSDGASTNRGNAGAFSSVRGWRQTTPSRKRIDRGGHEMRSKLSSGRRASTSAERGRGGA